MQSKQFKINIKSKIGTFNTIQCMQRERDVERERETDRQREREECIEMEQRPVLCLLFLRVSPLSDEFFFIHFFVLLLRQPLKNI